MNKITWPALLAVFVSAGANADHTMRCGKFVISAGDHQAKVAAVCGEPAFTETRRIIREGIPRQDFSARNYRIYSVSRDELLLHTRSFVEAEAEVWVFNSGPRRFMREIVFFEGKVTEVNRLGYGY